MNKVIKDPGILGTILLGELIKERNDAFWYKDTDDGWKAYKNLDANEKIRIDRLNFYNYDEKIVYLTMFLWKRHRVR